MKQRFAVGRVLGKGAAPGVLAGAALSLVFVGADRLALIDRKPPRVIVDHFFPDMPKVPADRLALAARLVCGVSLGLFVDCREDTDASGGAANTKLPTGEAA